MERSKRYIPSPAMLVALVALFVALGGAAYAAVTLPGNSVRSATIKNGEVKAGDMAASAVTRAKIANNAVNSAKVLNGSIGNADISGIAAAKITGKVVSAGAADTATNAINATNAANAANAASAASAANADKLDNLDSTAFQPKVRWALIDSAGTIVSQSGGISVATTTGSGGYYLNFGEPLTGKGLSATVRYDSAAGLIRGQITTSLCGWTAGAETDATLCTPGGTNNANHLWVHTSDAAGTGAPRDFYVAVFA